MKEAKITSFPRLRQTATTPEKRAFSLLGVFSRIIGGERKEIAATLKKSEPQRDPFADLEGAKEMLRQAYAKRDFAKAKMWLEIIEKREAEMRKSNLLAPRFSAKDRTAVLQADMTEKIRASLPASIRITGVKKVGKNHSHAANETRFFPDRTHSFAPSSARKR